MHEVSICEGIIQLLEEQAVVQDYKHVKTLWLEIGVLAGHPSASKTRRRGKSWPISG